MVEIEKNLILRAENFLNLNGQQFYKMPILYQKILKITLFILIIILIGINLISYII